MRTISIVGIGKLGLCFALNLEKKGYSVLGYDINSQYVDLLNSKMFYSHEPNVNEYLTNSKNFNATTRLLSAVEYSDTIFVVVATPSLENGRYDTSQIESVISNLESFGSVLKRKHFIVCCTVMPGYCDSIKDRLNSINYDVSYNPEFIAQGSIINDQLNPDIVLIGEANEKCGDEIQNIYEVVCDNSPKFHRMTPKAAELTKISLNCFVTTKITYANMIGDICIKLGVDYKSVLDAIGSDSRIGKKYLQYGYGYGGPCFPRDNRALSIIASDNGIDAVISKASDEGNKLHLQYQISDAKNKIDKSTILKLGPVSYKPGTPIIEESQQLAFCVALATDGYNVTIVDSDEVHDQLRTIYGNLFKYERARK